MPELKNITIDEFISKILQGERDFSYVSLEEQNLSKHERFAEMQKYLKSQGDKLRREPVSLSHSIFRCVNACGIHLPYLRGVSLDVSGSELQWSNFFGSYLKKIVAVRSNLSYCDLAESDFRCGNLRYANLNRANCWRTEFAKTDMRDIENLELTDKLGDAHFYKTKANKKEKEIIKKAISRRNLFSVERQTESYQLTDSN